tara:strand:- start:248 stop:916 length:669 start_codon:yes stop_codon:yes gene_type:complete
MMQEYKRPADKLFGEWLMGALTRHAISPSELARQAGVTRQSVSYWMETGRIAIKQVPKLEKIFGELSPATLAAQTSIYTIDTVEPTCTVSECKTVSIPLLNMHNAGAVDLSNFEGERVSISFANETESLSLFAIHMGKTMNRTFIKGDVVYIDTKRKIKNDDHVIVKFNKDEEAVFRVYRKEAGLISLTCKSPANKDYHDLTKDDFAFIGVVIGKFSNFMEN